MPTAEAADSSLFMTRRQKRITPAPLALKWSQLSLTTKNTKLSSLMIDKDRPSTWVPYRESLCRGCRADCCAMLLEVTAEDLVRLGLCTEDEARLSPKKVFKKLRKEKVVANYREATGLFMLQSKANGDCQFLNSYTRLCTVYEKRPGVCRKFPSIGPRPGHCPAVST